MKMAGIASVLLGLYSFTLPNTPPQNVGREVTVGEVLGLKTLRLMKERSFAVFVLCSLLISIPLAFYYNFTNPFLNDLGCPGSSGETESGPDVRSGLYDSYAVVPRPSWREEDLLIGMLAWVARYALFANGNLGSLEWMLYAGILLHGICYDFFFVTGQIYVDKKAPKEIRASAQGFIALITYGIGIGLGSIVSGKVVDAFTQGGMKDWRMIWWIPCGFALAVSLLFALAFKDEKPDKAIDSR